MKIKTSIATMAVMLSVCLMGCEKKELTETPLEIEKMEVTDAQKAAVEAVGAAGIAGVNWADGRDNFVDGWVIPSGLTAGDNYTTVSAKANAILTGFQNNMPGVNTVRLPINPPSVSDSWWGAYTGAIDRALSKNMKVILACWESASSHNGTIAVSYTHLTLPTTPYV